jgi:hypothetical protein
MTSTILAIAVIAALMVTASIVIALTITTEGVGISNAGAVPVRAHVPHCPQYNPLNTPPCKG